MQRHCEEQFALELDSLSYDGKFIVAFSGGIDSTALLHLAWARQQSSTNHFQVSAVHVNHHLHDQSDLWSEHCRSVCERLNIPCTVLSVEIVNTEGQSLEELARKARYQAMAEHVKHSDLLLLAHHQDDQSETFFLQLMRGAGPAGLAAMPKAGQLFGVNIYRPLLNVSRQNLLAYVQQHDLVWIDDPSNQDLKFDRNFVRHTIRPELESRWPAASSTIARAASHCAEQQVLCNELAVQDLNECCATSNALSISGLAVLSKPRIRNVLRYWVSCSERRNPSAVVLERVLDEIILGRADAKAEVIWADGQFRRYRDWLFFLVAPLLESKDVVMSWDGSNSLLLPGTAGVLKANKQTGAGLALNALGANGAQVHFRRGGEKMRPYRDGSLRSLKNLFQELGLPPWERNRTPLISIGSELVAVGDYIVAEAYTAVGQELGIRLEWTREPLCSVVPQ